MWPWKTQQEPSAEVLSRLDALERQMKTLRVDWDLMYEKFQRLSARLAKRARDAEDAAPEAPGGTKAEPVRITNPLAAALLGRR